MSFWTRAGPIPLSSCHASAGPVPESLCLPSQRSQHICPRHPGTRQVTGSQSRSRCRQIPDPRVPSPQASGSVSPSSGHDPVSSSQTRRQRGGVNIWMDPPPQPGPFPWELHGRCLWAPCFVPTPQLPARTALVSAASERGPQWCWVSPGSHGTSHPSSAHTQHRAPPDLRLRSLGLYPWPHPWLGLF